MFHNIWRVSREDWLERSKEAFEKALELDPSMGVARQHLDYHLAESPDTVGVRDMLDNTIRIAAGSEDGSMGKGRNGQLRGFSEFSLD